MHLARRDLLKLTSAAFAATAANTLAPRAAAEAVKPAVDDWPWWRGPTWNAHAVGDVPPLQWDETKNVIWKTDIAGQGHATPCIWGERIFLATADEEKQTQSLVCLDRAAGRTLWQKQVHSGGLPKKHTKNTHASATPCCDGQHLFVVFLCHESVWATALDFDGRIAWQKKLGAYSNGYGYGSSPTIFGRTIIVAADSKAGGFLVALDRKSGDEVWRTERPNMPSYGPPVVATLAGRQQLILQGNQVAAYQGETGRQMWHCQAPAKATACALCFDDEKVYSSGGYPERRLYAIRSGGTGDVSESHVAWKFERRSSVAYVPSPLLTAGLLFVVSDGGLATCLAAEDGREHWSQRLGGGFSASPIVTGDYIIAPNEKGRTFVFQAGDQYEAVAENALDSGIFASPVVCGGRLYLRTTGHLYCIGTS